jgi:hypothetical protein
VRDCALCALLGELFKNAMRFETNWLGDLSHNLAKVEVASSSLVSRAKIRPASIGCKR